MTRFSPGACFGVFLALTFNFLSGCGSQPLFPESVLETPALYNSNGFKLIKTGRYDDAEREFQKSLRHDPRNSAAHLGVALTKAYKGEREAALTSMKKSASLAGPGDEEYKVQVGWIRLYSVLRGEGWMQEAEKAFSWACSTRRDYPDAYYYMGMAYKQEYRIDEARAAFLKVLELRKSLAAEAQIQIGVLKKMESVRPISVMGRGLAVEERVTRAQMAALLFHELVVLQILKSEVHGMSPSPARDIKSHPLRADIEEILNLNIKGLTLYRDDTFGPDEIVTRAGFAITMADIIARAVNDSALIAKHASGGSPFPDVKGDAPYLGAALVCVEWGGDKEEEVGAFNPMGALAGYDAVLFIQRIRGKLNPP